MIELAIRSLLLAHAPLMALLSNEERRVDLVDVAQDVEPPYLTFNFVEAAPMGSGNVCNPAASQLLSQHLLITPWAPLAPNVHAINQAARAALLGGRRMVEGCQIDSISFLGLRGWQREPQTNLLTRGLVLAVKHNE